MRRNPHSRAMRTHSEMPRNDALVDAQIRCHSGLSGAADLFYWGSLKGGTRPLRRRIGVRRCGGRTAASLRGPRGRAVVARRPGSGGCGSRQPPSTGSSGRPQAPPPALHVPRPSAAERSVRVWGTEQRGPTRGVSPVSLSEKTLLCLGEAGSPFACCPPPWQATAADNGLESVF